MTSNYSTETPYESAYLKHKKAGHKHNPETWLNSRMQEEAIDNFRQLQISTKLMDNERIYSDICIRTVVKELEHAKNVCRMLDKYLDVLNKFPELEP